MRAVTGCAVVVAVFASLAQAAISPTFDRESAQPGDTVTLILGPGSEAFRGPLKFGLVAAALEASVSGPSDPRLIEIGDIGTPGEFDVPDRFPFTVPNVAAGDYVAVIWFRATDSHRWQNLAEGLSVALAIEHHAAVDGAAAPNGDWLDGRTFLVASVALSLVVIGLVILRSSRHRSVRKAP